MTIIFVLRHGKTNHNNKLNKQVFQKSVQKIIENIEKFTSINNVKRIITSHQERCYSSAVMLNNVLNIELITTEKINRCDEGKKKSDIRLNLYADKVKKSVLKYSQENNDYAIILITHSSVYRSFVKFLCPNEKVSSEWLFFRALTVIPYDDKNKDFYIKAYNYV